MRIAIISHFLTRAEDRIEVTVEDRELEKFFTALVINESIEQGTITLECASDYPIEAKKERKAAGRVLIVGAATAIGAIAGGAIAGGAVLGSGAGFTIGSAIAGSIASAVASNIGWPIVTAASTVLGGGAGFTIGSTAVRGAGGVASIASRPTTQIVIAASEVLGGRAVLTTGGVIGSVAGGVAGIAGGPIGSVTGAAVGAGVGAAIAGIGAYLGHKPTVTCTAKEVFNALGTTTDLEHGNVRVTIICPFIIE